MKKSLVVICAVIGVFAFLGAVDAVAAAYPTGVGGTGTTAAPSAGQVLIGTGSSTYTPGFLQGAGCVGISSASGSVALTVSCISGNQNIVFTITGDATGTANGTTSITDNITVTGLNGKALPANTTGTLQYIGNSWVINLATSSLGLYNASGALTSYLGSSCGGNQYVTGISASGTVTCGTPSGGASSTNVYGANGVTVVQVGVNATATLNTSYAAIWSALETFSAGLTANGTTTLASTTNALLVTNASGTVLAFAGSNPCSAGQFAASISATGTIGCANGVTSVNGSSGAVTITSSSLGVIYNPNWLTAAIQSINGATSSAQTFVGGTNISVSTAAGSSNSTTTTSISGVIGSANGGTATTTPLGANAFNSTPIPTSVVTSYNNATGTVVHNFAAGTGESVSTAASGGNSTTTYSNTGVTSFTGQGCVTAANSTGTVALTVSCISGNQNIVFTIAGDATGTANGTTAITDTITVIGLNGKALPALATGTLQYSGGAWKINLATSSLGLYDASGNLSSYLGSSCGSGFVTGFSATGTVACSTSYVSTVNGASGAISNVAVTNADNNFSSGQTVNGNVTSTSYTSSSTITAVKSISAGTSTTSTYPSVINNGPYNHACGSMTSATASTTNFNWQTCDTFAVTMNIATTTLVLQNIPVYQRMFGCVYQNATGSETVSWSASSTNQSSTVDWGTAGTPTLSTAASKSDCFTFAAMPSATNNASSVLFGFYGQNGY